MGAWGMQPFENDGAGDFAAELPSNPELLKTTLDYPDDEYLEIDEGQAIVACATVLALMNGFVATEVPQDITEWVQSHTDFETRPLIPQALQALDRVLEGPETSELYDCWFDVDDFEEWKASVDEVYAFLQSLTHS